MDFQKLYAKLNPAQKQAVDTIYGPVLVLAGPGTGKTQLLSARVANILDKTDATAQNIVCLTFTESGAQSMRARLHRFIGKDAYAVHISTYHGFGSMIIQRFPEYFTELRLERPIDDLGKREILGRIIDEVSFHNPIKQTRHHLGDLISTISEVKRGMLTPESIIHIADTNSQLIAVTKAELSTVLEPITNRMTSKVSSAIEIFQAVADILEQHTSVDSNASVRPLAWIAYHELQVALSEASEGNSTKPLTAWKNRWLVKDTENAFMLAGGLEAARFRALATVLEKYQEAMQDAGLYDFDDMINRAIEVLEENDEVRFTLQEQYQFLLLDEFQDTNASQLKIVQLLTDNPVNEKKPNVLAVGDDDQAIYAFQGAQYSNMLDFKNLYDDVTVIALSENYRSSPEVLLTAERISNQIQHRLVDSIPHMSKTLRAKNDSLPPSQIERIVYKSEPAELHGIARKIAQIIAQGTPPEEIAVLAPKHAFLENLVPYLRSLDIPVRYEKREDILSTESVRQLLTMCHLLIALNQNELERADSLWVEVLSYDFWGFSAEDIWKVSWDSRKTHRSWTQLVVEMPQFRHVGLLFLKLSGGIRTLSMEHVLDVLIGTESLDTKDAKLPSVRSPFRDYYVHGTDESELYEVVSHLSVLRSKLRDFATSQERMLTIHDVVRFVAIYEQAGQGLVNTSPYIQSSHAVQLMTVFKAKGMEWEHVFMLNCEDKAWGVTATGSGNKLTLPANVVHLRHAGASDDEKLRLLFVAITRAKYGLTMTSRLHSYSGKQTDPIVYFEEYHEETVTGWQGTIGILPESYNTIKFDESESPELSVLQLHWHSKHTELTSSLRDLLSERLSSYKLSPTHITTILNFEHGGPEAFLLGTLLQFPSAASIDILHGNTVHTALESVQRTYNERGQLPQPTEVAAIISRYVSRLQLSSKEKELATERAIRSVTAYMQHYKSTYSRQNVPERNFRDEAVIVGDAHLGGKIDLLEIDQANKKIQVVDFKTGKPVTSGTKFYRYVLQLYCYKILIEGSQKYKGYTVDTGVLRFVDPDSENKLNEKVITFDEKRLAEVTELIQALWFHILQLSLPSVTDFTDTLKDIERYQAHIIERWHTQNNT